MERLARAGQPHHEHPQLHLLTADAGEELTEVDLGLLARRVDLRDGDLHVDEPELALSSSDVARDGDLRTRRAMLGDQPLPDPSGGVPLLAWRGLVLDQPGFDHLRPRTDRGTPSSRAGLARWRDRGAQRLSRRASVPRMSISQLPDRQLFTPGIAPDRLRKVPREYPPDRPPRRQHNVKIRLRGGQYS